VIEKKSIHAGFQISEKGISRIPNPAMPLAEIAPNPTPLTRENRWAPMLHEMYIPLKCESTNADGHLHLAPGRLRLAMSLDAALAQNAQ
jgi:hypothetical protein